jgi:hypothetical protein
MSWPFLFGFTNAWALAGWLMLALLPRGPKLIAMILYGCVAILCLTYLILFALLFGKLIDPGAVAGASGQGNFSSIGGIRGLFASDGGIVIGWTHYRQGCRSQGLLAAGPIAVSVRDSDGGADRAVRMAGDA